MNCDAYTWNEMLSKLYMPGLITRMQLLFKPWIQIEGPPVSLVLTQLCTSAKGGNSLFVYKRLNQLCYQLHQVMSPGFPGN